jgi:uncharacterized membrane protein YoaT (DUF817 family)
LACNLTPCMLSVFSSLAFSLDVSISITESMHKKWRIFPVLTTNFAYEQNWLLQDIFNEGIYIHFQSSHYIFSVRFELKENLMCLHLFTYLRRNAGQDV